MDDQIIQELTIVGFSKITNYVSLGAVPRMLPNISEEKLVAVKELSNANGKLVIKLHDKVPALIKLGDYCGLWSDFNIAIATLKKYGLELLRDDEGNWHVQDMSKVQTASIED